MRGRGPPAFLQTRRCFSRCVTNKSLGRCLNFDLFQDTSGKNSWSWIAYLQDSPSFIFVDPFLLKIKDFVFCIFVSELIGVGTGAQKRGGGDYSRDQVIKWSGSFLWNTEISVLGGSSLNGKL